MGTISFNGFPMGYQEWLHFEFKHFPMPRHRESTLFKRCTILRSHRRKSTFLEGAPFWVCTIEKVHFVKVNLSEVAPSEMSMFKSESFCGCTIEKVNPFKRRTLMRARHRKGALFKSDYFQCLTFTGCCENKASSCKITLWKYISAILLWK